ncbi:hypothetical protein CC1G_15160 [Coprinopsis cinerea okayama7|uniref:Uncharacterized protein n=1 Tax=Coprinopsis cinerea (strain Okayama-7 / 130 / ATCC MYA-4618 / FGSC 9003) TaxID=240176 RepID=D6RPS7_COPC7|nr:hypothetical protein CC1G_15160 [Coprinopsis cinerea okayama7\|eukprot:XP_002910521.1 hypothetical protein CC1G_15160 [Coprinopsis cinerea okayama7\
MEYPRGTWTFRSDFVGGKRQPRKHVHRRNAITPCFKPGGQNNRTQSREMRCVCVRLYGTAESAESKGPWPQRIALCPRWWYMVQPERRGEERERGTRLAAEDEEREERALRSGIRNTMRSKAENEVIKKYKRSHAESGRLEGGYEVSPRGPHRPSVAGRVGPAGTSGLRTCGCGHP